MADSIQVSALLAIAPDQLYRCWLNGKEHARLTGRSVRMSPREGSEFALDDGAIVGTTRLLEPGRRIVQSLRDDHFEEYEPDSLFEVTLEPVGRSKTRLTLTHSDVPEDLAGRFKRGWQREVDALERHFAVGERERREEEGPLLRGAHALTRHLREVAEEARTKAMKSAGRAAEEPSKPSKPAPRKRGPTQEELRAAATRAKRRREGNVPDPNAQRSREKRREARQLPKEARPRPGKDSGRTSAGRIAAEAPSRQTGRRTASKTAELPARVGREKPTKQKR